MGANHEAMLWAEVDDISSLLHELSDEEWDWASLCEGWRVRDVIGHMSFGHTTPMGRAIIEIAKFRGNVPKGSFVLSKRFVEGREPDEMRSFWDDQLVDKRTRRGIARTIAWEVGFLDHFIHNQDMRRPIDRPRKLPEPRVIAALDLLPVVNTSMFATRPNVEGLRLEATDLDWSWGDGPVVRGTGEALVMAVGGREVALDELSGEGLPTLVSRVRG